MTDLLSRPTVRVNTPPAASPKPIALVAALASVCSVAAGILVTVSLAVAAWFAADYGSFSAAIRVGAIAWLVAIGGGLHLTGAYVTMVPLGSTLLVGWTLYRGGRWTARAVPVRSLREAATAAAVMGGACCLAALVVWQLTRSGSVHGDLLRTAVASAALGGGMGGFGVVRGARLCDRLLDRLPEELRSAVTGGVAGFFTLIAASSVLLVATVAVHFSRSVRLAEGMHTGLVGGFILALVGAALVPNGVLAAASYIAGPGFAVGTGTAVAPDSVTLGPVPSFPLLAALPAESGRWWQTALVVIPVVAGGVAGWVAMRRYPIGGLDKAAMRGGLAGLLGGVGIGLVSFVATGAVGPGRMAQVGPDASAMLAICAAAFTVGGIATATGVQWASAGVRRAPVGEAGAAEEASTSSRPGETGESGGSNAGETSGSGTGNREPGPSEFESADAVVDDASDPRTDQTNAGEPAVPHAVATRSEQTDPASGSGMGVAAGHPTPAEAASRTGLVVAPAHKTPSEPTDPTGEPEVSHAPAGATPLETGKRRLRHLIPRRRR